MKRISVVGLLVIMSILFMSVMRKEVPPKNTAETAKKIKKRTLIGYADKLTARPGELIEFKVSSFVEENYSVDLVRIINGDNQSPMKDRWNIAKIPSPIEKECEGRFQPLELGSYIEIPATKKLDKLKSFSVSGYIMPTYIPNQSTEIGRRNADLSSSSIKEKVKDQFIVSRYDASQMKGWGLFVDESGYLTFCAGNGNGNLEVVKAQEPILEFNYSYVGFCYDSESREVVLFALAGPNAPGDQYGTKKIMVKKQISQEIIQEGPMRIAAANGGPGASTYDKPHGVFNGKISDIRVVKKALDEKELMMIQKENVPKDLKNQIIANFDFSKGLDTDVAQDISGNSINGKLINYPERGVTGPFWDKVTQSWNSNPDPYDALSFHADDLYDADWQTDFSMVIPDNLKSGIYAARLQQGDFTEYITFFVAAPAGNPTAKTALWLSDYTYTAYGNTPVNASRDKRYSGISFSLEDRNFLIEHPEYAVGGIGNSHIDNYKFTYGSRMKPILDLKPGSTTFNFIMDTHIADWLENEQYDFDIITDELLHQEGYALLKDYEMVVTSSHPEYVSSNELNAVEKYLNMGGRLFYMGGNGFYMNAGVHPNLDGIIESRQNSYWSERTLVDGTHGGTWEENGRSSTKITGLETSALAFAGGSDYRIAADQMNPRAEFVFTGLETKTFGNYGIDKISGGAAGYCVDRVNYNLGTPRHALLLARANKFQGPVEQLNVSLSPVTMEAYPEKPGTSMESSADMVFFETPNGGAVLSTGSMAWAGSLTYNNCENDVARISMNIANRFLNPEAFERIPIEDFKIVDRSPEIEEMEEIPALVGK